MEFTTLLYDVDEAIATITLNRPDRLNTIVPPMPEEFEQAVRAATLDDEVKVIILRGAGRSFCAGYDFGGGFSHWDEQITTGGRWDPGKDFAFATAPQLSPTQQFMSMWRCPKPVVVQVHGWCVGGGSDTALCGDIVVASEDARIGTPYSRMWGAYLSGMWLYRLGLTKAKEYALTGKPLSGREAADVGLIGGPLRRTGDDRAPVGRPAGVDPVVTAGRDEAGGEPGLRQHGVGQHAGPRAHPRRADAQHAGCPPLHRPGRDRGRRGRRGRTRRPVR